jgi:hypothetical protein
MMPTLTAVVVKEDEVCRYDTRHVALHVHKFWKGTKSRTANLEERASSRGDYSAQLTIAERDIKAKWREYRRRMEARKNE